MSRAPHIAALLLASCAVPDERLVSWTPTPPPVPVVEEPALPLDGACLVPEAPVSWSEAPVPDGPRDAVEALDAGVPTLPAATRGAAEAAAAALGAGRNDEAAARFAEVARTPVLADWAQGLRAEALRRAGRLAESVEAARAVPRGSPHVGKAAITEARALRAMGRWEEAVAALRARDGEDAEGRMLLAETLAARGLRDEAVDELLAIDALFPFTQAATEALDRILALLGPERTPPLVAPRHARSLVAKGKQHFNAHRSSQAVQILARAAKLLPPGAPLRCEAQLLAAQSWDKLRNRPEALPWYQAAAAECSRWERLPDVLFAGGRAAYRDGRLDLALRLFARLRAEFPTRSTNDDALLYEAHVHAERGDHDARERALLAILDGAPDGDMRHDAAFLLIWDHWRAGDVADALAAANRALAAVPDTGPLWSHGRLHYWRARALVALGRAPDALEDYRRVLQDWPLSFYGQLALARIAELDGPGAVQREVGALEALARSEPGIGGRAPGGAWSSSAWVQGVALARMGLYDGARRAFGGIPGASEEDAEWMLALLADRNGAVTVTVPIARRLQEGLFRRYPAGAHRVRWQVGYPRPFEDLVHRAAGAAGAPEELAYAIMREESGFHVQIESWANALGLMQLLLPTAQWVATAGDGRIDRSALLQAGPNIALGTRLLGRLLHRLEHPALAVAAYNAGESSVQGWLRERGAMQLDEFVEAIPFVQTRRYTIRVMSTWAAYRTLRDGAPPLLDLTLPPASRFAKGQ